MDSSLVITHHSMFLHVLQRSPLAFQRHRPCPQRLTEESSQYAVSPALWAGLDSSALGDLQFQSMRQRLAVRTVDPGSSQRLSLSDCGNVRGTIHMGSNRRRCPNQWLSITKALTRVSELSARCFGIKLYDAHLINIEPYNATAAGPNPGTPRL